MDLTPFSQMDPRWKDTPLGFDVLTIGKYGCLLTCMTMLANASGSLETPATLNEKMKRVQGFQGALVIPAALPSALPGLRFRDYIDCQHIPAPLAEIDAALAQNRAVIVEVDYAPDPGLQNHWLVLVGKQGDDYLLRDPYPYPSQSAPIALSTSRYRFAGNTAQIIQAVLYLEPTQTGGGTPAALDGRVTASFPVFAAVDDLALRSATLVNDATLLKRVGLGTKLLPLEADAAARAKLGVINQWLAVRDPADGAQGYAAAWYLADHLPAPVHASAAASAAPMQGLLVKTIDEGVALRSQPEISDANLLKHLPVNSELRCTEPNAKALEKLGVVYQWLAVQDADGTPGYVAAWYVKAVSGQMVLGARDQSTAPPFDLPDAEPAPLVIRAGVEGLALRRLPLIRPDSLLRHLPVDGELLVLEPPAAARAKLGQMGEWLHARDLTGQEGYVAAWYAVARPDAIIDDAHPGKG